MDSKNISNVVRPRGNACINRYNVEPGIENTSTSQLSKPSNLLTVDRKKLLNTLAITPIVTIVKHCHKN